MLKLFGLGIPYNELSKPFSGNYKERFLPGAFNQSINNGGNIFLLWNHEKKYVLGRTSNGSLRLREDSKGIWFEDDLLDGVSWIRDLTISIKREDVNQMSFLFRPDEAKRSLTWEREAQIFNYGEAKLYELSIVADAMFPQGYVAVRGA